MQFFQLSSDLIYSPALCRVENKYGLAGLGFYLKVIASIHLAGKALPEIYLLRQKGRGLKWAEAIDILHSELFGRDENGNVMISSNEKSTGIVLPKTKTPEHNRIFFVATYVRMSSLACTLTGTPACPPECPPACPPECPPMGTQAGTPASDAPVLVDPLEKKILEEIGAEKSFFLFLQNECPHLLKMSEPITFDELKSLRSEYSKEEITAVLLDMNNKVDITTARSCFYTAQKWLRKRAKHNQ